MNIYDISRLSGLSIATVSRVINNRPNVSEATRTKVLNIMKENRYLPASTAQARGFGKMDLIGIMCSPLQDIVMAQSVFAIENELRKNNYHSILYTTSNNYEDMVVAINRLFEQKVDAIILIGSQFCMPYDNTYIAKIAEHIPIVIINGDIEVPNVYCHYCDDLQIVEKITARFIELGHRDIIFLNGQSTQSGRRKKEGYCQAMLNGNMEEKIHVVDCVNSFQDNIELIKHILEENKNISAVLATDDSYAVSALKAALASGMKPLDDISIVGYDNTVFAQMSTPEISSIDSKIPEMSSQALNILLQVLENKNSFYTRIMKAEYIERQTSRLEY